MKTALGSRLLSILMHNVSTRNYQRVIPEMAESLGVSKSSVSRQFIEASAQELERLAARRFDQLELLIIYLDGLVFGDHQPKTYQRPENFPYADHICIFL
jgi:putative transposase